MVGDTLDVRSRGKPAWVAKLGGKDRKYGREREFIRGNRTASGMRGQIVSYAYKITEPGEYEVFGDEFKPFRYTFTVGDHADDHRRAVESAVAAGEEVPPEVLTDYPHLKPKRKRSGGKKKGTDTTTKRSPRPACPSSWRHRYHA